MAEQAAPRIAIAGPGRGGMYAAAQLPGAHADRRRRPAICIQMIRG